MSKQNRLYVAHGPVGGKHSTISVVHTGRAVRRKIESAPWGFAYVCTHPLDSDIF
jgi:hypothetical protein